MKLHMCSISIQNATNYEMMNFIQNLFVSSKLLEKLDVKETAQATISINQ